jgi:hypothetical protein
MFKPSSAVATSRAGRRPPKSGRADQHRRLGRGRQQAAARSASVQQSSDIGPSSGATLRRGRKKQEEKHDQVDCCCWLLSLRKFGASNDTSAASSAGRHDHASAFGMRPRQDPSWWCLRGQNHHPSYPPSLPQGLLLSTTGVRSITNRTSVPVSLPSDTSPGNTPPFSEE